MEKRIDELSDGIFRLSAVTGAGDIGPHAYLIDADEPLLYQSAAFDVLDDALAAVEQVMPRERVRWLCPGRAGVGDGITTQRLLAAMPAVDLVCHASSPIATLDRALRRIHVVGGDGRLELGGRTVVFADAAVLLGSGTAVLTETVTATVLSAGFGANDSPAAGCLDAATLERHTHEDVTTIPSERASAAALLRGLVALHPAVLLAERGAPWRGDVAAALGRLADAYVATTTEYGPPGGCLTGEVTSGFGTQTKERLR